MIIYVILFLLLLAGFSFYFRRKNKKVFKILRALMGLVIVAVSTIFIFFLSGLINIGGYDIADVSMRENENIEVNIQQVDNEQIEIKLTNHERTTFSYTDYFICRKYENDQWEDMTFSRQAAFAKHVYELEGGQSVARVIRWEDFFGHKLKSGRYQLNWIAALEFEIDE